MMRSRSPSSLYKFRLWMLGPVFLLVLGLSVFTALLPASVAMYYLLLSLVTFGVFAADKWAAKRGSWRTSEKTLQLLSLAGGWPGGLLAQVAFRHKTSKRSFQTLFWVMVATNSAMFVALFTKPGMRAWDGFLGQLLN